MRILRRVANLLVPASGAVAQHPVGSLLTIETEHHTAYRRDVSDYSVPAAKLAGRWKHRIMIAVCGILAHQIATAQDTRSMPPVVLRLDTANFVRYDQETADWTKFGTSPGIVTLAPGHLPPFGSYISLADVVSVNGKPVKGVRMLRGLNTNFAINAIPAQAVADVSGTPYFDQLFVIQNLDGTVIGTLVVIGVQITNPAPAASGLGGWGTVVVGGSGAFLGVTGQGCGVSGGGTPPGGARISSVTEDPANRRINGGGSTYSVLCLIPRTRPEVVTTAAGPAIVHSNDYSLVTPGKPAKAGEILTLFASGLGPTRPGVDPGQPFTGDPQQLVIAPVEVLVNGRSSQVLYVGGYPGAGDGYQVNFQVPDTTASGTASVQMTSAWIPGPEVKMVIQ